MKVRIRHHLEKLRASYWFIPTAMLLMTTTIAFCALAFDEWKKAPRKGEFSFFYSGDVTSAQSLLAMVGGSAITVAGVVFSITITALTLASTQFGPRLLRNFMRDRGNQIVLGTFVSTYLYCLLIQRSLGTGSAVPHLSITLGVALGLASLCVLIYFIHHVSSSIQASSLVAQVGADLMKGIDLLFPQELGQSVDPQPDRPFPEQNHHPVIATQSGYLQAVDEDRILNLATEQKLIIQLHLRPGAFITAGQEIARIHLTHAASDDLIQNIFSSIIIGNSRSAEQDVEYSINQLVEICLRALSPSINDPLTAITCLDWIGSCMAHLANRQIPSQFRSDSHGDLRVICPRTTFRGAMDAALNQPRQAGAPHVAVMIRLMDVLQTIGRQCRNDDQRNTVRIHLNAAWEQATAEHPADHDLRDLKQRYDLAAEVINETSPDMPRRDSPNA